MRAEPFSAKNLKKTLTAFNIGLCILLILTNIIFFYVYAQNNYNDILKLSNQNTVSQIVVSYETLIKYTQDTIIRITLQDRTLKESIDIYDGSSASKVSVIKALEEFMIESDYMNSVYFFMEETELLFFSSKNKNTINILDKFTDFYDSDIIKNGWNFYISPPRIIPEDGSSVISLVLTVYSDNKKSGILVGNIDLNLIRSYVFRKLDFFDGKNKIIITDNEKNIILETEADIKNINKALISERKSDILNWDFTFIQPKPDFKVLSGRLLWFILASVLLLLISITITMTVIGKSTKSVKYILDDFYQDFWRHLLLKDTYVNDEIISEMKKQKFLLDTPYAILLVESAIDPEKYETDNIKAVDMGDKTTTLILKGNEPEKLKEFLDKLLTDRDFYVGMSLIKNSAQSIHSAYLEAKEALKYKFYLNSKLLDGDAIKTTFSDYHYDYNLEKQLLNNIVAGNEDTCMQLLDGLFSGLEKYPIEDSMVYNILYQIQNAVLSQISTMPIPIKAGSGYLSLNNVPVSALKDELKNAIKRICDEISKKDPADDEYVLYNIVMEEIEKNFMREDFCLNFLADNLNINKAYISKIVKIKTQENFPEYVNKKRIEYAKELLTLTDDTVEIIAKRAGFNYSYYFIKIFKETEGITPKQYRMSQIKHSE